MKRKSFCILLAVVTALLLGVVVLGPPVDLANMMAFPFSQIGAGLRALSLTGPLGNGLALALWGGVSVLPIVLIPKKADLWERIAGFALTAVLAVVLSALANPTLVLAKLPVPAEEAMPLVKGCLSIMAWSMVIFALVLRLLRVARNSDTVILLGYLRKALLGLCLLFAAVIPLSCVTDLRNSPAAGADHFLAVLRFVAEALPYALDVGITLSAVRLLDTFLAGEDVHPCAQRLSRYCCCALGLTAGATVVLNAVQLLLLGKLSDIHVVADLPIISIAFLLLILLVSRLMAENRKLQTDNDLFI